MIDIIDICDLSPGDLVSDIDGHVRLIIHRIDSECTFLMSDGRIEARRFITFITGEVLQRCADDLSGY